MYFEDLPKAPWKSTFQTFFQLSIETRQTQTNPVSVSIKDLTTFWVPDDLSLMSFDDFAAMVIMASLQVSAASL